MTKAARAVAAEISTGAPATVNDEVDSKLVPGFSVQRRSLFWLPFITASALLFSHPRNLFAQNNGQDSGTKEAAGSLDKEGVGDVGWEDFVKQSVPEAQELYKDSSPRGQDAYLFSLARWAARLRLETIPRAKLFRFGALAPPVHFGVGYRGVPFFAVEWWLEPGAILPPHNHPNASVCTLGIEGEARIRNFQIVDDAPEFSSKDIFRVRETHSELMGTGRLNSLSSTRDNIHTFQAGKAGARGIDFSTLHAKDIGFSFLNIEDKPVDAERRIYAATWRKLS
jgi:hypothetical protein